MVIIWEAVVFVCHCNSALYIWNLFITKAIIQSYLNKSEFLFYFILLECYQEEKNYCMKFLMLPEFNLAQKQWGDMLFQTLK